MKLGAPLHNAEIPSLLAVAHYWAEGCWPLGHLNAGQCMRVCMCALPPIMLVWHRMGVSDTVSIIQALASVTTAPGIMGQNSKSEELFFLDLVPWVEAELTSQP